MSDVTSKQNSMYLDKSFNRYDNFKNINEDPLNMMSMTE